MEQNEFATVIAKLLEMVADGRKSRNANRPQLGAHCIGQAVIVRTYSAGVHFGILKNRRGREVELTDSRRIWSWYGARTLSEVSRHGIDTENSRVAEPVDYILLTEAIEVIPLTEEARKNLYSAAWKV